ncbi:large ribosomal subunit protein eL24-like [Tigriopus californicus]|uniref:large ribosomal subunit protein eL24-like n=1 Tax=Tigriopus californicus TaxID=6832 RepID=UPI0027DA8C42|nr:large ribosomal subunit protein eL24-like [Tigriopus californicus]|eukprot:TCALIF_12600-PA protein Name:"Similar to rpl24 60S ribosomal protein L24 (Gillichthys mirabilis)" AED:0.02 eAED:0.02 QI:38/1/1/1/1/1/3/63/157
MRIELCSYSGYKVYPGRGRTLVRADGKSYKFLDNRCHKAHLLKRNPRKVTWTVLYRRKHKKGVEEETAKKRTKKSQKFQRAVVGATLQDILAKRNQKPEVRKAQREQAIRAAKDAKKAAKSTKKPAAAAPAKAKPNKPAQKASKPMQKAAPRVGGKR